MDSKIKRIFTASEVCNKMDMGLCYLCDEPLTVEHKSKHKNVRILLREMEDEPKHEIEGHRPHLSLSTTAPISNKTPIPSDSTPSFPDPFSFDLPKNSDEGAKETELEVNSAADPTSDLSEAAANTAEEDFSDHHQNPHDALVADLVPAIVDEQKNWVSRPIPFLVRISIPCFDLIFLVSDLPCLGKEKFLLHSFNTIHVPPPSIHISFNRFRSFDPGGPITFLFPPSTASPSGACSSSSVRSPAMIDFLTTEPPSGPAFGWPWVPRGIRVPCDIRNDESRTKLGSVGLFIDLGLLTDLGLVTGWAIVLLNGNGAHREVINFSMDKESRSFTNIISFPLFWSGQFFIWDMRQLFEEVCSDFSCEGNLTSTAQAGFDHKHHLVELSNPFKLLQQYVTHDSSIELAQKLILKGCEPLPRRWCFAETISKVGLYHFPVFLWRPVAIGELIAAIFPLYLTWDHRFPFYDKVFDLIHALFDLIHASCSLDIDLGDVLEASLPTAPLDTGLTCPWLAIEEALLTQKHGAAESAREVQLMDPGNVTSVATVFGTGTRLIEVKHIGESLLRSISGHGFNPSAIKQKGDELFHLQGASRNNCTDPFDHAIYGSENWIGATDCAPLLCSSETCASLINVTKDKGSDGDSVVTSDVSVKQVAGEKVILSMNLEPYFLKRQKLTFKIILPNHEDGFIFVIVSKCQNCYVAAVFHRKMIDWGRVRIPLVLIKWKALPLKHGTWKYSSLRTRMFEGAGIVTGK